MQYQVLSTPRGTMPLAIPEPADPQKWVEASMEQNLALTSSRLGAEIARDNVRTAFGGHLPTVDLVVGKSHSESADVAEFPAVPACSAVAPFPAVRIPTSTNPSPAGRKCPSGRAAARIRA